MSSEQSALLLQKQLKELQRNPVEGFSAGLANDNIYEHPPGEDKWGYESASERWLPIHTVETIIVSVISMLSSPNDESPANLEAAIEWRESYPTFKKKVQRLVRKSEESFY